MKCFEEGVGVEEEKERVGLVGSGYVEGKGREDGGMRVEGVIGKDERKVEGLVCLGSVWYIEEEYEGMDKGWEKGMGLDEKKGEG